MTTEIKKTDFIQSLEKGLKVISVFDHEHPRLTLTEVAKLVDLTRANARRILLTLEYLGYVSSEQDKYFSLTPKVLNLGYSYLSSLSLKELSEPFMQELAGKVNESCSMSVLSGEDIVYIARVQTSRIMTISLGIGTRLPVQATSMGKVLLSGLEPEKRDKYFEKLEMEAYTPHTITDKKQFITEIKAVRQYGWALADQELEIGVRSIACAIKDKHGAVKAALNISGHASRVSKEEMIEKFLPELQKTARDIEGALHKL